MGDMKVVDLDQQFIILAGIRFQGFADGDACTIQFDGPAYFYKIGADGEAIRSKNYNRSAIVTYRAIQSSAVNDLLSSLHRLDYNTPNGAGVGSFQYEDGQGTTLLSGAKAWIEAPPNVTIAAEGQPREWKIRVHKLGGIWGGN